MADIIFKITTQDTTEYIVAKSAIKTFESGADITADGSTVYSGVIYSTGSIEYYNRAGTYTSIKRTQSIVPSDIITFATGLSAYVDVIFIKKKPDDVLIGNQDGGLGDYYELQGYTSITALIDITAAGYYKNNYSGDSYYICVPKGTYADLDDAQTQLTGTKIIYNLSKNYSPNYSNFLDKNNENSTFELIINGKSAQKHLISNIMYSSENNVVKLSLSNSLQQWNNIVIPYRRLGVNKTIYDVMVVVFAAIGYLSEELDAMLPNYLLDRAKKIKLQYAYLKPATMREQVDKICAILRAACYLDDNGKIKFIDARPIYHGETEYLIPPRLQITEPYVNKLLRNKYDKVTATAYSLERGTRSQSKQYVVYDVQGQYVGTLGQIKTVATTKRYHYLAGVMAIPDVGFYNKKGFFSVSANFQKYENGVSSTHSETYTSYVEVANLSAFSSLDGTSNIYVYFSSSSNETHIVYYIATYVGTISGSNYDVATDYTVTFEGLEYVEKTDDKSYGSETPITPIKIKANELMQSDVVYTETTTRNKVFDNATRRVGLYSLPDVYVGSSVRADIIGSPMPGAYITYVPTSSVSEGIYDIPIEKHNTSYGLNAYIYAIKSVSLASNITYGGGWVAIPTSNNFNLREPRTGVTNARLNYSNSPSTALTISLSLYRGTNTVPTFYREMEISLPIAPFSEIIIDTFSTYDRVRIRQVIVSTRFSGKVYDGGGLGTLEEYNLDFTYSLSYNLTSTKIEGAISEINIAKEANIFNDISQAIITDYRRGIYTATQKLICGDLIGKDFSKGDVLQLGDIITPQNKLNMPSTPSQYGDEIMWRIIGRKLQYNGTPTLNLNLQQVINEYVPTIDLSIYDFVLDVGDVAVIPYIIGEYDDYDNLSFDGESAIHYEDTDGGREIIAVCEGVTEITQSYDPEYIVKFYTVYVATNKIVNITYNLTSIDITNKVDYVKMGSEIMFSLTDTISQPEEFIIIKVNNAFISADKYVYNNTAKTLYIKPGVMLRDTEIIIDIP